MTVTISLDFETLGHHPSANAAISLGAAAYTSDGFLVNTFNHNIQREAHHVDNADTLRWWAGYPQAYAAVTLNPKPVAQVMALWQDFVMGHSAESEVVLLGYNSHYDMSFLTHLVYTHTPQWQRPSLYCIELRDVISQSQRIERRYSAKKHWPTDWVKDFKFFEGCAHTPLYDAMLQAHIYFKLRRN